MKKLPFPLPSLLAVLMAMAGSPAFGGTVSGTILRLSGEPLEGVSVHLDQFALGGENGPWNATTNAAGTWSVSDGLLFGNVRITPAKAGFVATPLRTDVFFDTNMTVNFRMDPPGIRGVVRDAAGAPAAALTVVAKLVSGGGPALATAVTDAGGAYLITTTEPLSGVYEVHVQNPALFFPVLNATVPAGAAAHAVVDFTATAPYTLVRDLPPTDRERAEWADYDDDGRADMLLFGGTFAFSPRGRLLRQTSTSTSGGALTFAETFTPEPVTKGMARWRDFDNDGDLDFALAGQGTVRIYSQQEGAFALAAEVSGLFSPRLDSGDVNNDGREDLLISGIDPGNANAATFLILNRGGMVFERITITLNGLPILNSYSAAGSFIDFDQDGDLDVALSGFGSGVDPGLHLRLHQNHLQPNDRLIFTASDMRRPDGVQLPPLPAAAWAWADINGDGRPDPAYCGNGPTVFAINAGPNIVGDFRFDAVQSLPRNNEAAATAWGDLNGDGLPELIESPGFRTHRVLDGITGAVTGGAPSFSHEYVAMVDVDGDHRLDVALTGHHANNGFAGKLLSSPDFLKNALPTAPTGLGVRTFSSLTGLTWQAARDATTPAAALTYNIRMGTTPGGVDIVSPEANPVTGRRWIFERGPIAGTLWPVRGLPRGVTLYWAVQAIDAGCEGGEWSAEHSFVLPEITGFERLPDGAARLRFSGGFAPGVEASTDLLNWNGIGLAGESAPGTFEFTDVDAPGIPRRFYRIGQH